MHHYHINGVEVKLTRTLGSKGSIFHCPGYLTKPKRTPKVWLIRVGGAEPYLHDSAFKLSTARKRARLLALPVGVK